MQNSNTRVADSNHYDGEALMERVRACCLAAAQAAYEDAGVRGLCAEGRWECALDAIRALKLSEISDDASS